MRIDNAIQVEIGTTRSGAIDGSPVSQQQRQVGGIDDAILIEIGRTRIAEIKLQRVRGVAEALGRHLLVNDRRGERAQGVDAGLQQTFFVDVERRRLAVWVRFKQMIENDLPFGPSTAQMLMAIARNKQLSNADHGLLLPTSWRTLYELTRLTDEQFDDAIEAGKCGPMGPN